MGMPMWTSDDERMADHTVPANDSNPEPPSRPVVVRRRRRVPRRTQAIQERILIQDEPINTAEQNNIQILRVGPRLREVSNPAVDQARASENRAAQNEQRRGPVEAAASENVLAWLASPDQAEGQIPPPTAAPRRGGRSMRSTRRLFISDGRGSGRSYYSTANGTRTSLDEDDADQLQEELQREFSPSTGPPSTAGLSERLANPDQSHLDLIRRMEAEMTPWSMNDDPNGPTPQDIYREACRRLDNSNATGDERRALLWQVQRGMDGMLREERQSSLDMWPRGFSGV